MNPFLPCDKQNIDDLKEEEDLGENEGITFGEHLEDINN